MRISTFSFSFALAISALQSPVWAQKMPIAVLADPHVSPGDFVNLCVRVRENGTDSVLWQGCDRTAMAEEYAYKTYVKGDKLWKVVESLSIDTTRYRLDRLNLYRLDIGKPLDQNLVTLRVSKKSICPKEEYVVMTDNGMKAAFAEVVLRKYAKAIPLPQHLSQNKIPENYVIHEMPAIRPQAEVRVCWRMLPKGWQTMTPKEGFDEVFSLYNCITLKAEQEPSFNNGVISERQMVEAFKKIMPDATKTTAWVRRWSKNTYVDEHPAQQGYALRWEAANAQNYLNDYIVVNAKGEEVIFIDIEPAD